jgi:hypothetical protein
MKRITLAVMIALFSTALFAQEENAKNTNDDMNTLFGKGNKTTIGWFVGPTGGYTRFCSSDVALAGIQAGMVINHNFTIGLAGSGVANSNYLTYNNFIDTTDVRLEGGYGGLLLEYTLFPKSAIHVSFPLIIGGGTMGYYSTNDNHEWDEDDWDNCDHQEIDQDAFFVVIPGVTAEVNILKFMRFGVGVSYRYTPDLDLVNTSSSFINNFTASASLKFGKF